MSEEIASLPAYEVAAAYRRRTLSPVEVVDAVLERIDRLDSLVNTFVTVTADTARAQARIAEKAFSGADAEHLPALYGIPVSVKDLENTAGVQTTYGSVHYTDNVPTEDAIIWARLKKAGSILIGKTTTPELGASGVTESELTGITRNPWNLDRTVGGSSGGAAAAVASGFGSIATGSDGGGSIRVPASYCGVVGLKPSAGRIPFNNADAAYEPVTTTGPITRTVRDAALILNATHGPDPFDPISLLDSGHDFATGLATASLRGVRIAYSPDLGSGPVASTTRAVIDGLASRITGHLGAHVERIELDLPDPAEYFFRFWTPLVALEQEEVVLSNPEADEADYPFIGRARAMNALEFARTQMIERSRIHTAFARVFEQFDLLIWPTTASSAFPHPGLHGYPDQIDGVPVSAPDVDNQRLTEAIAHAGYPAISVPAGLDAHGLPVGLQIAASHGRDRAVLEAAACIERAWPWSWPTLSDVSRPARRN